MIFIFVTRKSCCWKPVQRKYWRSCQTLTATESAPFPLALPPFSAVSPRACPLGPVSFPLGFPLGQSAATRACESKLSVGEWTGELLVVIVDDEDCWSGQCVKSGLERTSWDMWIHHVPSFMMVDYYYLGYYIPSSPSRSSRGLRSRILMAFFGGGVDNCLSVCATWYSQPQGCPIWDTSI